MENQRLYRAEDRSVRADAESQRGARNQRQAGALQKHPRAVAQVLPQIPNPSHAASVAASLLRLLNSAESLASGMPRLFRIHSQADVLLGLLFDVVAQFLVQFALHFRFAQ